MLGGLWRYRHFVLGSIRNDLVSRFARSKLGGLWMIINPLVQVGIYALVLSNVLAAKIPGIEDKYAYAIYLMAGLLAWTLFSELISQCLNLFVRHGNLLKKMSFPRITLPAIALGTALLNNGLLLLAMLAIFLLLGHPFDPLLLLWLVPLTLLLAALGMGLGLIVGVFNVFLRDIGQAVPAILQIWFWMSAIVYPIEIVPDSVRRWIELNPLIPVLGAYRDVLLYGRPPELDGLIGVAITAVIALGLALFLFRRGAEEMVDVL